MQINFNAELKKGITQYNKTGNQKDFDKLIPNLVSARLLMSVAVEQLKNVGNASAELMKNSEFCGVFLRTKYKSKSYLVAFTDEAEMRKGQTVCTLSLGMKEYCEMLENTDAEGIIINPFSRDAILLLSRELVLNDMLPAVRQVAAMRSAQEGDDDGRILYNGSRMMQFNTIPAEFFKDPDAFVNGLKTDKENLLRKHLMVSQLLACNQQDKLDGLEDKELKKERADRIMIAKGKSFDPSLYFFNEISEEYPKMYMLDFPPQMQVPVLCKRMYFLIGENDKKAVYTVEASYNNKQFLCEITENRVHNNYGETQSDSAFEETKRILELFGEKE